MDMEQYKRKKIVKVIGIYAIINTKNNKAYIGQSIDVRKRLKYHYNNLKIKKHPNSILQSDWLEFKQEDFEFQILEECKEKELNKKETFYIEKYDAIKNGYNLNGGNKKTGKTKARYKLDVVTNPETGEYELEKVLKEPEKYRATFYIHKENNDRLNGLVKRGFSKTQIANEALSRLFKAIDEGLIKIG